MRTTRSIAALLGAALALAACSGADASTLTVDDARSRLSPMVAGAAAVYLDIDNPGEEDDVLRSASVPEDVAARVELHETTADGDAMDGDAMDGDAMDGDGGMDGDDAMDGASDGGMDGGEADAPMMRMREVEAIEVPAGSTVSLQPGGLHLMLMDLVADLQPGDEFELTLEFEHAGTVTVTVEVREDV